MTGKRTVRIGTREVGDDCPPYVVAEACINHEGDIALARRMVYLAHAMGADAIKFQMHVLDDEMLRDAPQSANFEEPLYDALERTNLSLDAHRQLKALCEDLGIDYLCTPFSKASADLVDSLDPVAIKVGSGELTNLPLQRHIASKRRPMIVSTGMSTIDEIGETVEMLRSTGVPFVLTHCVSIYPCPPSRVNLGNIPRYRELFDVPVGLSDHTASIYTSLGAVALGACVIEKHLTLDRAMSGPDHKSSLEAYELGELVKGCRAVFEARGADRRIFPEEEQIAAWARESVVSTVDIESGVRITPDMVAVKRPSPGAGAIAAKDFEEVIGKTARVAIKRDRQILRSELALMARRVLATLESRATYGYSRNVMRAMRETSGLELVTLVTGMHLMPELGNSIELIRADGFPISATVPMTPKDDGRAAWSRALGTAIADIADAYERLAPDLVLIFGDRAETFACCVAATYMGLPIAHVQAGDKSGHVDDAARMAMAKLAHIHLASCADSAERLRRLGEQEFRIFDVGAPQLDDIVDRDFRAPSLSIAGQRHDLSRPYLLVLQHPVMSNRDAAGDEMRLTLEACVDTGMPVFCIYPNSDFGYRAIVEVIEAHRHHQITLLSNVERDEFLTLLANAAVLVGNSSSGILEAPSFKTPVVNIGERQRGRPQATNILNCAHDTAAIRQAIARALGDAVFRAACAAASNPYGDGRSGPRICRILETIALDARLLDKETVY